MADHPRLGLGLPRDTRNTAPETRARFEYQDACVVLRCIPNLMPDGPIEAVVIEWTTDYAVLSRDGRVELVSVKHREQDQRAWTFGDLVKEHVFRDLHGIWKEIGEGGDFVFESSRAIGPHLRAIVTAATDSTADAAEQLATVLGTDAAEAARFAAQLVLPESPTPDRRHIREVAAARMAEVMSQLGLDPALAPDCVTAMQARVADIAVDRPLEPEQRVRALAGLMRDVRDRQGPSVANYLLTMDELRDIVTAAATGQLVPARARPPITDPLFTGRDAELGNLAHLLAPRHDGMVTPAVLTGMPGIGKTALAARFAATSSMRARVIPADTRASLLAGIYQLNPPEPPAASAEAGLTARPPRPIEPTIPDDPGLLVIIEGLTDPAVVAGLIPRASRTTILITTTCPHVDDGYQHMQVGGLGDADAQAYLLRVLPAASEEELPTLIEAFNGNALGFVQAANYCLTTGITPGQYVQRLQLDPAQMLDRGQAAGHPQTLAAAISAGLTKAYEDPAARALASALSWLAPDPLPEWIFRKPLILVEPVAETDPDRARGIQETAQEIAALADPLLLDTAVVALARYGLISRGPGGLRMHHLVQEVARTLVNQPTRCAQYEAAVGLLLAAMGRDDTRPAPDILVPHVAAAVQAAEPTSADPLVTSYLMWWLGNRHYDYGDLGTAASYLQQAATLARRSARPQEMPPALFHDLVKVHRAAGAVDAALANADEWANAAKSAGKDLDEYHARFARVATLAYASRFAQAETELSALASESKPAGLTASDKIIELSVLAAIRRDQGDAEAALDAINQATQLARDKTAGRAQADHLAALSGQASQLERDLGHPAEAVERQREAVNAARELGLQIPLARQLHGLASRLIDCGYTSEAAEALEEMMHLTGAGTPASRLHGDYLQTSGRLALANDDPGTARQLLTEAIPLLQASGEPNRPDLASAWYNLGTSQMALGEPVTAAASYRTARDIEASIYGDEHPDLITSEFSLAAALHASANFAAAGEAISRCLQIIRRGGAQARIWRDRALILAIIIDVEDGPPAQQR